MKIDTDNIQLPSRSRLILGGAIFVSGFLAPLLIPVVAGSNLSIEWKSILSGVLALGIPEVFMLIAITILGKPGFNYIKTHLWSFIRPPDKVSQLRYRTGLVLFFSPVLFGWFSPYLELWISDYAAYRIQLAIAGDIVFAVSLFILGGDFWLKIKALFMHENKD